MAEQLPSPFYRVTAKALIKNHQDELLVVQTETGAYELPGGGWEHNEPFEDCLRREIAEEIQVGIFQIGPIAFVYRGHNQKRGYHTVRLVASVVLDSTPIVCADNIVAARYIGHDEFVQIDWQQNEGDLADFADVIWPVRLVEANA